MGLLRDKTMGSSAKDMLCTIQSHSALKRQKPVYILILFFPATFRHGENSAQALFSKPQVAAALPLALHCQVQELGLFYQDGANLG